MNRYVFIFDYGSDWMILLFKDGDNYKYYNSAENGWDNAICHADDFIENGGNKYYYKIPSYDYVKDIEIFDLKNEPIAELVKFIR